MFKRKNPSKKLVREAERLTDELANLTAPIEAVCWELDSVLSNLRKDAAGYRVANKANPTGGENYTEGELEAALVRARQLHNLLSPVAAWARAWENIEAGRLPLTGGEPRKIGRRADA